MHNMGTIFTLTQTHMCKNTCASMLIFSIGREWKSMKTK